MKNLTLALDETLLSQSRAIAAKRKTTVNNMVREFLQKIAETETQAEEAMRELARMSNRTQARLGERSWTREELYDR